MLLSSDAIRFKNHLISRRLVRRFEASHPRT